MINRKSQFIETDNILFIGAHIMGEIEEYSVKYKHGLFIEADPNILPKLENNLKISNEKYNTNYIALAELITNIDDNQYDFNIFSNNGASSSIYSPDQNNWAWPHVTKTDTKKLKSKRINTLLNEVNWEHDLFDVVIDVQGAELEVIKSFDNYLDKVNNIMIESSCKEFYTNQSTIYSVHKYLIEKDFILLDTYRNNLTDIENVGQGDLIYGRHPKSKTIFKTYQSTL